MKILLGVLIFFAALISLVFLGLQVQPGSFPAYPQQEGTMETVPLTEGLPAPVEHFYRQIYGENIPVIHSAVITGKVSMRPVGGITFPGRFRFTHAAGKDYRHYIEATVFGLPVMKVNEHYIDGKSRMELPFGVIENEPKIDQAANLGLWAESIWLPAIFITDERVRWEAVDDYTSLLVVPFGEEEERFVVRFDQETGMPRFFEAMRYKEPDDEQKSLWICETMEWGLVNDRQILRVGALTWFGDAEPWAVFTIEDIVYNVEVEDYVRGQGI